MVFLLNVVYTGRPFNLILLGILGPFDFVCSILLPLGLFLTALLNQMFQPPSFITIAIAATRMHRCLVDFASRSTDMYDVLNSLAFSGSQWSM